jgi:NADH:ubiquinone reductase (H+-translocating)
MLPLPHIIIVGAGFGGLFTAKMLKRTHARITIIDKQNHHVFQPLLYQVATGFLSPEDVAVSIREEFQHSRSINVIMDEVTGIEPTRQEITTRSGKILAYDYLVLATGSVYNYFSHEEWKPYALSLKTLDDALEIRRRILLAFEEAELIREESKRHDRLRFIIIGGGPTGVEMAGAIADIADYLLEGFHTIRQQDISILIIESGSRLLAGFPPHLSEYTKEMLVKKGVTILLNTTVEEVHEDTVITAHAHYKAGMVLWSAGVKPSPTLQQLPFTTNPKGRINVTENLSLPNYPTIFAIGDTASFEQSGKSLPELASVAKQQGKYVGRLLRRKLGGKSPPPPFHYQDWGTLATIGRNAAVAEIGSFTLKGWLAYIFWGFVHILLLTSFRNRVAVFINWLAVYFSNKLSARIIIKRD